MAETRRQQMTKLLFRTALIELLQQKPFHKISVTEICKQANLNRATFYLHYTEPSALLQETISDLKEKIEKYIAGDTEHPSFLHQLEVFLKYVRDNSSIFYTLMKGNIDHYLWEDLINDILKDMQKEWPVYDTSEKTEYIYTFVMHGSSSVIASWIESAFNVPVQELAGLLYKMCQNAVLNI